MAMRPHTCIPGCVDFILSELRNRVVDPNNRENPQGGISSGRALPGGSGGGGVGGGRYGGGAYGGGGRDNGGTPGVKQFLEALSHVFKTGGQQVAEEIKKAFKESARNINTAAGGGVGRGGSRVGGATAADGGGSRGSSKVDKEHQRIISEKRAADERYQTQQARILADQIATKEKEAAKEAKILQNAALNKEKESQRAEQRKISEKAKAERQAKGEAKERGMTNLGWGFTLGFSVGPALGAGVGLLTDNKPKQKFFENLGFAAGQGAMTWGGLSASGVAPMLARTAGVATAGIFAASAAVQYADDYRTEDLTKRKNEIAKRFTGYSSAQRGFISQMESGLRTGPGETGIEGIQNYQDAVGRYNQQFLKSKGMRRNFDEITSQVAKITGENLDSLKIKLRSFTAEFDAAGNAIPLTAKKLRDAIILINDGAAKLQTRIQSNMQQYESNMSVRGAAMGAYSEYSKYGEIATRFGFKNANRYTDLAFESALRDPFASAEVYSNLYDVKTQNDIRRQEISEMFGGRMAAGALKNESPVLATEKLTTNKGMRRSELMRLEDELTKMRSEEIGFDKYGSQLKAKASGITGQLGRLEPLRENITLVEQARTLQDTINKTLEGTLESTMKYDESVKDLTTTLKDLTAAFKTLKNAFDTFSGGKITESSKN